MALVYCRSCGRQISDQATACPHCGEPGISTPVKAPKSRFPGAWLPLENVPNWVLIVGVIGVLVVAGSGLAALTYLTEISSEVGSGNAPHLGPQVTSRDGRVQLTLPSSWIKIPPVGEGMILFAASQEDVVGVYVFAEEKEALMEADLHFRQVEPYAEFMRGLLLRELAGGREEVPRRVMIGGRSAVQCILHGSAEGEQLTMVHTIVETPTTFYQVRAFAASEMFDSAREELLAVTDSLRLHEAAAP